MKSVVVDKIASVTQGCSLGRELRISADIPCAEGVVVVVEVTGDVSLEPLHAARSATKNAWKAKRILGSNTSRARRSQPAHGERHIAYVSPSAAATLPSTPFACSGSGGRSSSAVPGATQNTSGAGR